MEFGYWGIKGAGETIRWLIAYLGLDVKEYNPASREEWFDTKKAQVGGEFPNLPYLVDGDFKLTESGAIPSYLIKKSGKTELLGKTIQDEARVRQIEGVIGDIRQNIFKVLFAADEAAVKAGVTKAFEAGGATASKFEQLSKFLGDKEFLLGYLTYADLLAAYYSEWLWALTTSLGVHSPAKDKFFNLATHAANIHKLPGIKERAEASQAIPYMPPAMLKFHLMTFGEVVLAETGKTTEQAVNEPTQESVANAASKN